MVVKRIQNDIIPALMGYFVVYDLEDSIALGEPVIAWRIETIGKDSGKGVFSICHPITVDGDMASNCIGVQNPDMTVTLFENRTYSSLSELEDEKYSDQDY